MPEESKLAEKLENTTKFTEEELKKITGIQDEYSNIQNQFGQLSMSKIALNSQLESLEELDTKLNGDLKDLQQKEKEFLDGITKKYGEGSLNPKTGEFTPNKS